MEKKIKESSEQSNQGMTEGGEWEVYDFQIRGGSLKNYNPAGLSIPEGEFDTLIGPIRQGADSTNTHNQ